MAEQILRQLDSILAPAMDYAWHSAQSAKLTSGGPGRNFLDLLRAEVEGHGSDLSETMYMADMAMQGHGTDVERAAAEMGGRITPETGMPTGQDGLTNDYFEDTFPATDVEPTGDGLDSDPGSIGREVHWQNPFYGMSHERMGVGTATAGALTVRPIGMSTPWRTGDAFRGSTVWYRKMEIYIEHLKRLSGLASGGDGRRAQGISSRAIGTIVPGKLFFAANMSTVALGHHAIPLQNWGSGTSAGAGAAVDVLMGTVGVFNGPVAWAIAGTYMLHACGGALDALGQVLGPIQGRPTPGGGSDLFQKPFRSSDIMLQIGYCAPAVTWSDGFL